MAVITEQPMSKMTVESRWSAEYWRPELVDPLSNDVNWKPIGSLLAKTEYGLSHEMNENQEGVPCYRMNEMDGIFLSRPHKFMEVTAHEFETLSLKPGDVLFNRTNSLEHVGRTGILADPIVAVFASYLVRLVPHRSDLLPEYLTLYLNTPTGIAQVKRRAMESINQANVSASEIRKVPIPHFPMSTQKEIASLVQKASAKRREGRKCLADAETRLISAIGLGELDLTPRQTYTRSIHHLVGESRFDAEYFNPKYQRLIEKLRQGGQTLGDVCTLAQRKFIPGKTHTGESFDYIEIGSLTGDGITEAEYVPIDEAPSRAKWIVKSGDVITSLVGSERRLSALIRAEQENFVCTSGFAVLSAKKGIEKEVLLTFLRISWIAEIISLQQTGTILAAVPTDSLMRIPIKLPDAKSRRFVVSKVNASITARCEAADLLEQAKRRVEELIEAGG